MEENEQFRELYLLVFALNQPADLQEIFDKSVVGIQNILNVDRASLLITDDEDVMRFRAWSNLSADYRQAVDGHSPWAADEQNPQPVLISNVKENRDTADLQSVFEQEGIQALGFFPMVKDDRLIGKFMLYHDTPHTFPESEVRLAQIVAKHIVQAIDRLQTQQELHSYAQKQSAVADLGQYALKNYSRIPELMNLVVEKAVEILEVDLCGLLALEPDKQSLRVVDGKGWNEGVVGTAKVEVGLHSQAGYTMMERQPVIVTDFSQERRFEKPDLLREHDVVSGMTVVIEGGDRPFGVLGVHTTSVRRFHQDEVNLLLVLANILAAAIQQNQALTKLQSSNELLEERVIKRTSLLQQEIAQRELVEMALKQESAYIQLLYEINQIANEAFSLEKAFRLILQKLCGFMDWPLGHIYIQAAEIFEGGRKDELVSSEIWHCKEVEEFDLVQQITSETKIKNDVSWIGKGFNTGKPSWIKNVSKEKNFSRREQLTAAKMQAGFAFPVLVGDEVAALMEFFTSEFQQPDDELMEVMAQIGTQMGRIVERERSKKEAKHNEKNLRVLASRLINGHEEERSQISHELHDEIGQLLIALKLELDMLIANDIGWKNKKFLTRASEMVKTTLTRIQVMSYDLRPPELDTIGMEAALHDLCQDFANRRNVTVEYKGADHLPAHIPKDIQLSLYRALQEGLNDAAKNSDSNRIVVKLSYQAGKVSLFVTDSGRVSLKESEEDQSEHELQLLGLSERFARFGGLVTLSPEKPTGMTLKVVVPVI
jgi:GAF domain-containing protein